MSENDERTRTFTWDDPATGLSAAHTLSGLDYLRAMQRGELPSPPIAATLDFTIAEIDEVRVVFTVIPAQYHYNPIGAVHGGLAATLCDSAMGCAVHSTLPAGTVYTTIERKVSYIRALTKEIGLVRREGKTIAIGGRIATAEAPMTDESGTLHAHATTCLLMRPQRREHA